jgi:hypothetical protein
MTQLLAGSKQSVSRMDLGAKLLSQRVERRFCDHALERSQPRSARMSFWQR